MQDYSDGQFDRGCRVVVETVSYAAQCRTVQANTKVKPTKKVAKVKVTAKAKRRKNPYVTANYVAVKIIDIPGVGKRTRQVQYFDNQEKGIEYCRQHNTLLQGRDFREISRNPKRTHCDILFDPTWEQTKNQDDKWPEER